MTVDDSSSKESGLRSQMEDLRVRLAEAEETLRAIRNGEVDALVMAGAQGEQVFTLKSADYSYRVFLEEMHEGALTLSSSGTILYCNRRFAEMVGAPLENMIGGAIGQFVREADLPALEAILHGGLEGAGKGELTFVGRDGGPVPVYLASNLLRLDEVEAVCLVVTDLTEQKRNQQLVADEKLARSIFEHATEAIIVCDQDECVLRASLAARRLCVGDPVGKRFSQAFPLCAPERQDGQPLVPVVPLGDVLAGRTVQGIEASLPLDDGTDCQFQVSAGPLLAADDRVLGCVLTLTDVTGRRRAEMEADRARREAEAASQAKDRFLANLSHELRTPLTPVLAIISGLQNDGRLPSDTLHRLAMVRRNVDLEARLIDDMLDLTRVSRGKLELRREAADLRQIIEHSLQTASQDLLEKRQRLVVDFARESHSVWGDSPRLTQVFWNLFSNAVKFTPASGTITVRSSRAETPSGPELVVEVADSGIGIDAEALPRIFDAFNQGEGTITRRFGGLGLGLAISKAIVELHGGTLAVASAGKDQGAVFSVRLPASDLPPQARGESRVTAAESPAGEPPDRALHILLVEDHADTAEAMADLLGSMGHRITVAHSVAGGLAAAERQAGQIDLVLSDLGLPDGSGLSLMRELHRRYEVKGIALSGYGMEQDVRDSLEAGFERHLTKPIDPQVLQAAIRETAWGRP
jgi:PAS domain S-box-containing protein